jgi:DNA-binding Xre family transcriptional regulator
MTADKILDQIIEKGSMLGTFAEMWRNDKVNKNKFLMECFEMSDSTMAKDLWGPVLTEAIKNYCKAEESKDKLKAGFNRDVIETIKELRQNKWPKQDALAEVLGMTQGNYSKLERGLVPLTFVQFEIISTALNVSIPEILTLAINRKSVREKINI